MKNYYSILEVNEATSTEVIKASYKALIKKYHPDNNDNGGNGFYNDKMAQINEAFEVLSDESRRKQYDDAYRNYINHSETENGSHEEEHNESNASADSYTTDAHSDYYGKKHNNAKEKNLRLRITIACIITLWTISIIVRLTIFSETDHPDNTILAESTSGDWTDLSTSNTDATLPNQEEQVTDSTPYEVQVYDIATGLIRRHLSDPSGIKFPEYDINFISKSNTGYIVNSYVDYENQAGTLVRSKFTVEAKKVSSGYSYSVIDFEGSANEDPSAAFQNSLLNKTNAELLKYLQDDTEGFFNDLQFGIKNEDGITLREVFDDRGAEWDYYSSNDTAYAFCFIPTTYINSSNDNDKLDGYLLTIYKIRIIGNTILGINDLLNPELYNISDMQFYIPGIPDGYNYQYLLDVDETSTQVDYKNYLEQWMPLDEIKKVLITSNEIDNSSYEDKGDGNYIDIYTLNEDDLAMYMCDHPEDFFNQLILSNKNDDGISLREYVEDVYNGTWYFIDSSDRRASSSAYAAIPLIDGYYVFEFMVYTSYSNEPIYGQQVLWHEHMVWADPFIGIADKIQWGDEFGLTTYSEATYLMVESSEDYDLYNKIISGWGGEIIVP